MMPRRGDDIGAAIESILRSRGYSGPIDDDLPLGSGGASLDSIAIAEVLLACEETFGIAISAELLGSDATLTVGRLIEQLQVRLAE